jgi:hypothetical protein
MFVCSAVAPVRNGEVCAHASAGSSSTAAAAAWIAMAQTLCECE